MVTACAFHLPLISEKWRSEKQNTQLCSVQWFQDYGKNVVKCHQSPFSGSRLRLYSFLILSVQGYLLFEWLLSKSSQQVTFILAFSKHKWYLFDPRHRLCISEECYMLWWQFFLLLCGFFGNFRTWWDFSFAILCKKKNKFLLNCKNLKEFLNWKSEQLRENVKYNKII